MAGDGKDLQTTGGPLDRLAEASAKTLKGRAGRFLYALFAGTIGHSSVKTVRDKLDELDGRSRVNAIVAEEVGRRAIQDPEFMRRASQRLLGETLRKQENVEAVLLLAADLIDQDETASSETLEAENPDPDWINSFTRVAEDATSDQLRELLAKVLAGEIKQPGSCSRNTLRIIYDIDRTTIEALIELSAFRSDERIITDEEWSQGRFFQIGVELETLGLISGHSGFTNFQLKFDENGTSAVMDGGLGLFVKGTPSIQKVINVWILTRSGSQILNILTDYDVKNGLRRIAEKINKDGIEEISLGRIVERLEAQVRITKDEMLWPRRTTITASTSYKPPS